MFTVVLLLHQEPLMSPANSNYHMTLFKLLHQYVLPVPEGPPYNFQYHGENHHKLYILYTAI